MVFASLHIVNDGPASPVRALRLRSDARKAEGFRGAVYMHTGRGTHVDPERPDPEVSTLMDQIARRDSFGLLMHPTRRVLFVTWTDGDAARRFTCRAVEAEHYGVDHTLLRPLSSRGAIQGADPIHSDTKADPHTDGEIVIATSGYVPWRRVLPLQRAQMEPLSSLRTASGMKAGLAAFVMRPRMQVFTWTRWEDQRSGLRFAYQGQEHADVIARQNSKPIFANTWFARFEVTPLG
jgi:hypothetical protein